MYRILFICTGNICRSPMAEFVLKDMATKQGRADEFYIASCATSTEEIGNPVHYGTKTELAKHGISCAGKTAVQLKKSDYDKYDYLIAMDQMNVRNIMRIIGKDPQGKVSLLLDFTGENRSISDPWYTGDFETTYKDVYCGCKALLDTLK